MCWYGNDDVSLGKIHIKFDQLEPDDRYRIFTKTIRAIDQDSYLSTAEKINLVMYCFEFLMARTESENTVAGFDDLASVFFIMSNQ